MRKDILGDSKAVATLYHIGPERASSRGWVVQFDPDTTSLDAMFDAVIQAMNKLRAGVKADDPNLVPYPLDGRRTEVAND